MLKAFCVSIFILAIACAARAQPASSADGAFDVGPYRMVFSATQGGEDGERYHRQIPGFGPTRITVEFADAPPAAAGDVSVEVQLLWGKNELKPPQRLETHESRGVGAVSFEHVFDEDGKYIIAATAREPGGAEHHGQYIFFVIQTADPHLFVSGLASAIVIGLIYFVWRHRRAAPAPRRHGRL